MQYFGSECSCIHQQNKPIFFKLKIRSYFFFVSVIITGCVSCLTREDMYAQDSIELLTTSGIQFKKHEDEGIETLYFAELLMTSGVVLCDGVKWLSFHRYSALAINSRFWIWTVLCLNAGSCTVHVCIKQYNIFLLPHCNER